MTHKKSRLPDSVPAMVAMFLLVAALLPGCSGSSGGGDDGDGLTPLSAPNITFCDAWGNVISLAWDTVSGAEQYNIYRETSATGAFDQAVATINAPSLTWTDPDTLEYDVTYYYKMRASAAGRETSAFSNLVSGTTKRRPTLTTPTFNSWSSTDTTVTLNWTEYLDASDRYLVYRDTSSMGAFDGLVATVYRPTVTFTDTGLSPGTTYWYKIMSKSAGGEISDLSTAYFAITTGDGGGGGEGSEHVYLEIAEADLAIQCGINAATTSTDSSSSAYRVSDTSSSPMTTRYYFNDFTTDCMGVLDNPITLNGSILISTDTTTLATTRTGTVNVSGCDVSAVIDNLNSVGTTVTGTIRYEFTDGSIWVLDAETLSYTEE